MADGIPCKHCVHQETTYEILAECGTLTEQRKHLDRIEQGRKKWPGHTFSLARCTGYVPENPEIAEELARKAEAKTAKREGHTFRNYHDD